MPAATSDDVEGRLPGQLQATFWPGGRVPADGHVAWWGTADPEREAAELALPAGDPATVPVALPASPRARTRVAVGHAPCRLVPVLPAARALAALPAADRWPAWDRPSDAMLAWSLAAKLAFETVAAGRIAPEVRAAGAQVAVARWRAAPPQDGRLAQLAEALPPAAHALRADEDEAAVWSPVALLSAFADAVADACARASPRPPHAAQRTASWSARLVAALTGDDPLVAVDGDDAAAASLADRAASWAAPLGRRDGRASARLCVRLHTPDDADPDVHDGAAPDHAEAAPERGDGAAAAPERGDGDAPWRLTYLLQAADDPSLVVPAERVWDSADEQLELLGRRVSDPQESLVAGLAEAARVFSPIDQSLSQARPSELALDAGQAAEFVGEAAQQLAGADIGVWLPAELTAHGARRLRARLRVGSPSTATDPGQGITGAGLDADGIADFQWEAALGDEALTPEEFAEIVALKQPLVRWRGRWVRVDPDEALELAERVGTGGTLEPAEALSAALAGAADAGQDGEVQVVAEGAMAALVDRLRGAGAEPGEPRLDGIAADLRDYQRRGAAWLQAMGELGLGGVLADDMGLGKTLQTIALLADRARRVGDRPHLVVCPTSVIGNWERELARFGPDLAVVRHHGGQRIDHAGERVDADAGTDGRPRTLAPHEAADALGGGAVVITSYGLLRRDGELFAGVDWDVVVLDEAQQVKNPASQGAKTVRRLPARQRVALTGTPMENRLSELWSIVDFTNRGLLGSHDRFKTTYSIPVERWGDEHAAARLRRMVSPFVMRRTKTDPTIAADLPDKHEIDVTCSLTREQATLYAAAVDEAFRDADEGGLSGAEGADRRGRVLALLTALKQICNHPAQYLGETAPLAQRSGKLARVAEMLAEITAAGERALVFTQYQAMGKLLAHHLGEVLGLADVPLLHGGTSRTARERLVEAFQTDPGAPPVLLVSLKAGGTGLNLTAATHVVHFDRWWNPAVEDQATDRAFRIGQTRTVTAHKLVTAGTVEERIAELIAGKRALADAVVGSGEGWIAELGDDDLRDLVALSASAVADDEDGPGASDHRGSRAVSKAVPA